MTDGFDLKIVRRSSNRNYWSFLLPLVPAVVACIIPVLVAGSFDFYDEAFRDLPATISTIGVILTVFVSYYTVQRLGRFPGTRRIAYVIPATSAAFSLFAILTLIARYEFSRYQLVGTFSFTCIWFLLTIYINERRNPALLAIIPIGRAADLLQLGTYKTITLEQPVPAAQLQNVQGVIADLRADLGPEWLEFLTETALAGVTVYNAKQVLESLTGTIEIETLSETPVGSLEPSPLYSQIRPVFDFVGSIILLPVLVPMMLIIALIIKLDSPGPALFTQQRMGHRGKPFKIYKFRTMTHRQTGPAHTTDDDPRITRIGAVLRRLRIDELPQVINILKGEMSWIGPRPEAVELNARYEAEIPFFRYRYIVKPGITGWAQVQQGHVFDVDDLRDKLHHDLYFIKYFSPWLDLLVIVRTVQTVLTGFGAR